MKAMSVVCALYDARHSSGDCVDQSAAITPLNGRSLVSLFDAGMVSVIALGMCNVSVWEMSIPMRWI